MRQLPIVFAALAAVTVATPAWAWGGSPEGGGGGKDKGADCCAPEGQGGGGTPDKADCCGPEARSHGHDHDGKGHESCPCPHHMGPGGHEGAHGDMHGHGEMHGHGGMKGHRGMMGMHARRMMGAKSMELRYMPATTGNQHLVLAWDRKKALSDWFSMGFQGNYALQLAPAAGQGHWFTPYGGFLPRIGTSVGNVRLDAGALLGVGAMLRTTSAGGTNDVLQLKPMWVVEPRVELGFDHGAWRLGVVGTYALSPNPAEFSGPSVGVRVGFGGSRRD